MYKLKLEAFYDKYFWNIKKNRIYKSSSSKSVNIKNPDIIVPQKYSKIFPFPLSRLFRTGIHTVVPIDNGCIVVVKKRFLIYEKNDLIKVIDIPRGSRPLRNGMVVKENNLFFGDYWGNKDHEDANVYKLNLNTYTLEVILSLKARHIHFVVFGEEQNELIIGTGDNDDESKMLFYNIEINKISIIGEGSQKFRAVSIIQKGDYIIWGTDAPDEQNYIYSFNRKTNEIKKLREIGGPAYYSTLTSLGEMYIATTIEDKLKHKAILYKTVNMVEWIEVKEFKKDFLNEKYFGYGLVEFMHGQEKVEKLHYNLVNLYEK